VCSNYTPALNLEHVIQANREIGEREALRNQRKEQNKNIGFKKGFLLNNKHLKLYPEPMSVDKQTNDYVYNICKLEDVISTLIEYGYKYYNKDDLDDEYTYEDYCDILEHISHTKSFFIYEVSYPPCRQDFYFFNEVFQKEMPYIKMPQFYIAIRTDTNFDYNSIRLPYINVFKDFVINVRLKHNKRCSICLMKKKCFKSCFRCHDKYCSDCFNKFNDTRIKDCPYCRYSFHDHIQFWLNTLIPDNNI